MKFNRLSKYKIKKINCFAMDLTATATGELLKINRKTINNYFTGVFELDESYFGAKRVRGKRGRGAAGKTPVFGVLKHEGKVFVRIVPRCSKKRITAYNSKKNY